MRFIQIWILPDAGGLPPSCEQRAWSKADHADRLHRVMAPEGAGDPDAIDDPPGRLVYVGMLSPGIEVSHEFAGLRRGGYLYVIDGRATVDGEELSTGDAVAFQEETSFSLRAGG